VKLIFLKSFKKIAKKYLVKIDSYPKMKVYSYVTYACVSPQYLSTFILELQKRPHSFYDYDHKHVTKNNKIAKKNLCSSHIYNIPSIRSVF